MVREPRHSPSPKSEPFPIGFRVQHGLPLISEICLSTLHAEYVGLSMAVRALIPLRHLIESALIFHRVSRSSRSVSTGVTCKLFEDNQGAFLLATNQRLSPRSRYFNSKLHFFWSYVYDPERNPQGWLTIVKCPTEEQNADYLTKGLARFPFEANRKRVQGW